MSARFPVNGSAAQLAAGDVYGIFRTLFRDSYYHAEIGPVDAERLQSITALFGRPWDARRPVSTVAPNAEPRFAAETRAAIPAHNECAYTPNPPRLLALHCTSNSAEGGDFFALSPLQLLEQIGQEYRPSLRTARYSCRMSEEAAPFGTTLLRDTAAGEQIVFTSVAAMTGGSPYELVHAVDEYSAGTVERLRQVLNDPANRHRHTWRAGDLIVLDNLRLMHGREAFADGERVLHHLRIA